MPYTLRFSDVSNTQTVIVPDMPPGINTIDTSLSLVGKNYPNYGEKIAENFLHLLENFAGPIPPDNPIEGQLWYDTSDPTRKVLRVMDGTTTNTRWPSATGIYQQGTDPKNVPNAGLKTGDIWVDTANNQLKIYKNNNWILVGPSAQGQETGSFPEELTDTLSVKHWVVRVKVEGNTVGIFYNGPAAFTPNPAIAGFSGPIRPGLTLSSQNSGRLNSTAIAALNLEINSARYSADKFLRKNDTTGVGQIIEGKVSYITPSNQIGSQGRDGLVINVSGFQQNEYLQLYKLANDGVFLNNKAGGKLIFKTNPASGSGLVDTVTIENRSVGINTSTNSSSPTLDVYGNARILSTLTVISTSSASIVLNGGMIVSKGLLVNETLQVSGTTTFSNTLITGNVRPLAVNNSIGTKALPYQNIHAVNVYAQNYLDQPGTLRLWAGSTTTSVLPEGWMFCTGTNLSTSTYSDLFSVINYHYGGSGSSFYIPNLFVTSTQGSITTTTYYIIKT